MDFRNNLFQTGLALAGAAFLSGAPASAQDATATAREAVAALTKDAAGTARDALAALAKEEAASPAGRLTVRIEDRRAPHVAGEKPDEQRSRVLKETAASGRGSFLYGKDGWVKDLTVDLPLPQPRSMRTRTSESPGELRVLMEMTTDGKQERRGRVARITSVAPGDAILSRRVAGSVKDVEWTAARREGTQLTLEGKRGTERHTLTLLREGPTRVRNWTLVRRLTGPAGEQVEQTYRCEILEGKTPADPLRMEEWVITPPPGAGIAARLTEVQKAEPLPMVAPEELRVRFPAGTLVTDVRNEVPVEYEQAEDGKEDGDIAEAARLLAVGRTRAGDDAPPFELKDPKGKTFRLDDFEKKPLVLVWFSGKIRNAETVGGYLRTLGEDARKKGAQVLLLLGEDADWKTEAEALRKQYAWQFPVVVDEGGQAMRRYGLVAALPKIAVVDREGTLVYVQAGLQPDEIAAALEKAAAKK